MRVHTSTILRLFFVAALVCTHAACGLADLQPNEVVIVAARGNRESEGLAKYYARVRAVPVQNICLVDVPPDELCQRERWQSSIRPEIHNWLDANDPLQKIRCLVTVWGIPLKIGPSAPSSQSERHGKFLEAERAHRIDLINRIAADIEAVAVRSSADVRTLRPPEHLVAASSMPEESSPTFVPPDSNQSRPAVGDNPERTDPLSQATTEISKLRSRLDAALQRAQSRVENLNRQEDRITAGKQLQQLAATIGGLEVLVSGFSQRLAADRFSGSEGKAELATMRGRLTGYAETRTIIEQSPSCIERDATLLSLIEQTGGLFGTIQWLDQQVDVVKKNETGAAFDSELALVMWPDDYELLRWQPNYLRSNFSKSQLPRTHRTLMVSRIDAPTLRLAKGLIDTAIEVEQKGLRGKVYIDSRGAATIEDTNLRPGSYADYDRSLLICAKTIKDQTDLEVVVENTPQLFQPGQCKDAALYCGAYSLAKYVDAFEWTAGAVGYHLAGAEAATLHDPASQVWCKMMLEHGVCATIGPVFEPYLAAFPRPDEFFTLLVHGDRTLVECYSLTNPFNSWMMVLVGDPLYRPFKYRAAHTPMLDGAPGVGTSSNAKHRE